MARALEVRLAVSAAQPEAIIGMRDRNEISDTVLNRLPLEFDQEVLLRERYGGHAGRPEPAHPQ